MFHFELKKKRNKKIPKRYCAAIVYEVKEREKNYVYESMVWKLRRRVMLFFCSLFKTFLS